MSAFAHRACSLKSLVGLFVVAALLEGCGSGHASLEQAKEEFYKNNPEIAAQRKTLGKLSGRVTVDGMPPKDGVTVFVVLNNPEHPTPGSKTFAACDAEGNFEFKTYEQGDGVPVGKYVVEIVGLRKEKIRGRAAIVRFVGPDAFGNLYNDPDKNKDDPTLVVDVQAPGRTDYAIDLKVAGKNTVAEPGKNAITKIAGA